MNFFVYTFTFCLSTYCSHLKIHLLIYLTRPTFLVHNDNRCSFIPSMTYVGIRYYNFFRGGYKPKKLVATDFDHYISLWPFPMFCSCSVPLWTKPGIQNDKHPFQKTIQKIVF